MKNSKFEIRVSTAGKKYFTLVAKNGEVILTSEEYESGSSAIKGIASVRTNSKIPERYIKFVGKDGQYYFNLRAGNNKVIGVSEGYKWKLGRWIGIRAVTKCASPATIDRKY